MSNQAESSNSSSGQNTESEEPPVSRFRASPNSDDEDNEPDWPDRPPERRQPLYRTSHVNLLSVNDDSPPSTSSQGGRLSSWNVPTVQINDVPVSEPWAPSTRFIQRYRLSDLRNTPSSPNLFRPRFLHPLYAGVNPFDADLDDSQREQMYDGDTITTVTPNHRIQAWDISKGIIPDITNCKYSGLELNWKRH